MWFWQRGLFVCVYLCDSLCNKETEYVCIPKKKKLVVLHGGQEEEISWNLQ